MLKHKDHISIPIKTIHGHEITLELYAEMPNSLFEINAIDAYENGEEVFQLKEGCFYE